MINLSSLNDSDTKPTIEKIKMFQPEIYNYKALSSISSITINYSDANKKELDSFPICLKLPTTQIK